MTRSRQYGFWLLATIAGIAGPFSLQPAHLIAAEPVAQGWRGNGTGVFPASQPPLQWSTSENIAWFAPLPSWSTAQPVVAGDRIFVLSEPNQLFCLSRDDGKVLWQRSNTYRDLVGEQDWPAVQKELDAAGVIRSDLKALEQRLEALTGKNRPKDPASVQAREDLEQQIDAQKQKLAGLPLALKYTVPVTHETLCGYTTATPTSDGKHVWAVFGNCLVVCYDMEGNRQWMKKLDDKPQAMWGHSASPLLVGNRLFVNIDALVALDADTGDELWRRKYCQCWGSTQHVRIGDEDVLIVGNGRLIRARDGQPIGRGLAPANVSAIVDQEHIYFIQDPAQALRIPKQLTADWEPEIAWEASLKGGNTYASPVLDQGKIFTVSAKGILTVLDTNGQTLLTRRLDFGNGTVYPSLTAAHGTIYISHDSGTTIVLKNEDGFPEVARNQLDPFMSSPVFAGNNLLIRTRKGLYCIAPGK